MECSSATTSEEAVEQLSFALYTQGFRAPAITDEPLGSSQACVKHAIPKPGSLETGFGEGRLWHRLHCLRSLRTWLAHQIYHDVLLVAAAPYTTQSQVSMQHSTPCCV